MSCSSTGTEISLRSGRRRIFAPRASKSASTHDGTLVTISVAARASGSIGVLGPTRMDYLRTMAAVQAVARYLGDVFEGHA